ncbi:hypothetical protein B0J12DRAFT_128836 [Macrophomina phaseolina]|uniref:RING-type domain-containing protein n=1 Tax=Macrophomina phaseolina TaxID=35725 RepID=A0ABQ8G853_9PEZI|nr:hypothetical protein B0J12DRAFT_128836 [Macrophomina phaseolina]
MDRRGRSARKRNTDASADQPQRHPQQAPSSPPPPISAHPSSSTATTAPASNGIEPPDVVSSRFSASSHQERAEKPPNPIIDDDDLCPICHLLLHRPVRTTCAHTLCQSCMAHWADVSAASAHMTVVPLTHADPLPDAHPGLVEARCPIVQSVTVFVGNTHRLVEGPNGNVDLTGNCHEWSFFVRLGETEMVEEVQIVLHPTFRPSRIIRAAPPYQITRIGWGRFTIQAYIILKAGYSWISEDAQAAPDGADKGMLPLEWMLSFDGDGSMGRCRLKIRNEAISNESSSSGEGSEWEE